MAFDYQEYTAQKAKEEAMTLSKKPPVYQYPNPNKDVQFVSTDRRVPLARPPQAGDEIYYGVRRTFWYFVRLRVFGFCLIMFGLPLLAYIGLELYLLIHGVDP
jgi:hypothetical protein